MSIRLSGKTVSFTGGFEALSRNEAIQAIKSCGATFQKQVNKNVDALVTGETKVGIRKLQAENLGIQIISAGRFQQYIRNKQNNTKQAGVRVRPVRVAKLPEGSASRFVRDEVVAAATPRMPWEEEITPRFGKIPRRGRPAGATTRVVESTVTPKAAASKPSEAPKKKNGKYSSVVFAGDFNFPMSQLAKLAEQNGASIASSMRTADLVVTGDGQVARVAGYRARDKGLQTMSELEFLRSQ